MEDLEVEPHPDFVKGFNEGYLLSKEIPELADKLAKALDDSEHATGFKDGRAQYEAERQKEAERYPDWLSRDRFTGKETNDKGDPEKDAGYERE